MRKYQRLIYHLINKPIYAPYRDEAYAVALLAFCKARREFDSTRGVPFVAFLVRRIEDALLLLRRQHYKKSLREISYETPLGLSGDGEALRLLDVLGDDGKDIERADLRLDLCQAKALLTPLQRRVIELVVHRGFTQRQAAENLGISQQAVSKHKRRALAILRRALR